MKTSNKHVPGAALAALALIGLSAPHAKGADHLDSPAAMSEPSADISDFYAWTAEDGEHLNMVMTVMPLAGEDATFSDATQYAFHVHAHPAFGTDPAMSTLIVCQFYSTTNIECWAQRDGDTVDYLEGDASMDDGAVNDDETMRVYAGVRNDPFYFNLDGFLATASTVRDAVEADALTFDDNGCPDLDEDTATALVTQLMSDEDGGDATDDLDGANVLAIVMQVELDAVSDEDNRVFSLWASTHAAK